MEGVKPEELRKMPDPGRIPGPVVIPSCVAVILFWGNANSRTVLNILHGIVAGGFTPTAAICNALLAAIQGHVTTSGLGALHNNATSLFNVGIRDLRAANLPLVEGTAAPLIGTSVSPAMPASVALVATLRTSGAGRGFRGRVYVPNWATNAQTAAGQATAGAVTALSTFMGNVQTDMAAQGITLALAQPARATYTGTTGTVHPARTAAAQAVTSITVRNAIFDSQRRRNEPS